MTPPAAIDRFARHVAAADYDRLSAKEVEKAKTFLLDSLGVGIAGSGGASIAALKEVIGSWGTGAEATVWVTGERLPAQLAAMVNAYQIHCLEFDCVHEGAVVHPMATVLSAMMAHAERRAAAGRPVAGRDFLAALCAGVDVATLLGVAATGPIRFFRPATAGGFGAAAALARLDELDETGVKNTLGALYCQTSGTMQAHVEGAPLLGLQIGFNARAALAALDLTHAGIAAPHDVIDGPHGYLRLMENGAFDLAPALDRLGDESQITQLAHKPFPSGRLTHGAVDALIQLSARHGFGAEDIVRVEGRVPPLVYRLVGRPDQPAPPANYAKLCLAFVAGVWMARGRVDVPDFAGEAALEDPDVHRHAATVVLEEDDNPDPNALDPQWFAVTLDDGRRHEIVLDHVLGHPANPLSAEQNVTKFRRCASYGSRELDGSAVAALMESVETIETRDDAAALAGLLVAG